MGRFAFALALAVIGGSVFGIGTTFFQGFVPNDSTRWAFYFFFGIPAWIAAQVFGEALYVLIVPSKVRMWGNVARGAYLVFMFSIAFFSALKTSNTIIK